MNLPLAPILVGLAILPDDEALATAPVIASTEPSGPGAQSAISVIGLGDSLGVEGGLLSILC